MEAKIMNENMPKNMQKFKILQTPTRLNYAKEDFKIIFGDLCKQASDANTPCLVEVSFLNTDETEATPENTVFSIELPIFPERYAYEKTVDDFFTFWTNQGQANTLALMRAKPRIPEYANYIEFKVMHTPSHIQEFLKTGKHEEFERFRQGVDSFMDLVRRVYPEQADQINTYIASCVTGSVKLQGLTEKTLKIASYRDAVYPIQKDSKQSQRLVDCLGFNLAQACRWAFENCEDDKAKTLQSFKTYDDDFVLDMKNNGRIADAVCEITLPTLKKFENILCKAPSQPGSGNN